MVRAPCCEKMGLKRGPWAPEEDRILISHIQKYGHSNWRALPRQAGLLRCGKSCRLRWKNYLRPDIKRGNFSMEEEETIIKLHEMLGNRWSAIAAKLPGRTDNEIKNVWHSHLKKRLKQKHEPKKKCMAEPINGNWDVPNHSEFQNPGCAPTSPQPTSTDGSSVTEETCSIDSITAKKMDLSETLPVIEEDLRLEPGLIENSGLSSTAFFDELQFQIPFTSGPLTAINELDHCAHGPSIDDGMDFWYNLFIRSGSAEDIPQT